MNPREKFKTRPRIDEARELIINFLKNQKLLNVSIAKSEDTVIIDAIDYFYFKGEHIAVLSPASRIRSSLDGKNEFYSFVQVGIGKMSQKLYATFNYQNIDTNSTVIDELALVNPQILKMRSHNAKFLKLTIKEAIIILSDQEMYNIDNDLNPTFAKFAPNGRERFENSRKLLMEYTDREVIFNCVIENDIYYALTKVDSNKMNHINSGGICKIYDGKGNHFDTTIKVEANKTDEVFAKLVATNNAYFKENAGLVALSFKKN